MRILTALLALIFSGICHAAQVNWTNFVPNIDVATNAYVKQTLAASTATITNTLTVKGDASVAGAVKGNTVVATNSLTVDTTIKAAANLIETPELYLGASRIYRSALTPVDAGVSLDFASTNRYWSITLTGNVTFATANITAGKRGSLRVNNTQATNCTYTLPAWNPIGAALPTTIAAGKVGVFDLEANSTTDASIDSIYAQQP